ncbi:hypothetical protein [Vulgatibacter incomptus]|uniref:Lipoprotein n=1 Tax=Vulgatibacter incomptus TaxID=1391653 RepID=A0A0K1PAF3_9BACT|nr:hypothetical protein [Vulgatibacter incomptus]AKU90482.1 hypothetical protein AKJ08_0869 [Vulgatibacter incomptus]
MRRNLPGPLRALLLVAAICAALTGCHKDPPKAPAAPPASEVEPESIAQAKRLLSAAGIAVTATERLNNAQEFPGCPVAELRFRIHFSEAHAFLNASKFATAEEAEICRDDFRAMALKGGASAWERLRRDVAIQGSWLYLFPPELPDPATRERIIEALGKIEPQNEAPTPR